MLERPLARGFAPWLGATLLRLAGWKVVLAQPVPTRCVVIFYPHTSNWDTVIGLCVKFMTGLPIRFVGKDTLFRVPLLGPLLAALGRGSGQPARTDRLHRRDDRASSARNDEFRLAIAPEGTRGRAPHWKSGFYHLARAAGVPLALGFIDYPRREIGIGAYLDLTGDVAPTWRAFARSTPASAAGIRENQGPVRLRDEPPPRLD